jgi:acyl-CoA thioester hydrolase
VNNVAYFRYQETSRLLSFHVMLDKLKPEDKIYGEAFVAASGVGPILSNTTVNYKYPLQFPDTILVGANILPSNIIDNQKMIQIHAIWGIAAGRVVADGEGTLISYDYASGKKADRYPDCIVQAFSDLSRENSLAMLPDLVREFNL